MVILLSPISLQSKEIVLEPLISKLGVEQLSFDKVNNWLGLIVIVPKLSR